MQVDHAFLEGFYIDIHSILHICTCIQIHIVTKADTDTLVSDLIKFKLKNTFSNPFVFTFVTIQGNNSYPDDNNNKKSDLAFLPDTV